MLALALALALAVAGCGGDDEPDRPGTAELAALCDEARKDVEALGLPAEAGIAVVRPWANRGTRLAEDVRRLDGETRRERELLGSLATAYEEYYAGLRLGATIYAQTKSTEAYAATVERGKPFLADADRLATQLGAPVHRAPVRGSVTALQTSPARRRLAFADKRGVESMGVEGVASSRAGCCQSGQKQSIIGCR